MRIRCALALALCLSAGVRAEPLDLEAARALILDARFEEAYARLAAREAELAGDPSFDYLLGVAALESGEPARATLAFERALAVDPNFLGARLDMARAYVALGVYDLARAELETLEGQDPPPAARAAIERYLAVIEARTAPAATVLTGYAEAALGTDSNVNNGPGISQVFVPVLGASVNLSGESVDTGDEFLQLAAGGAVDHGFSEAVRGFAGLDLRGRGHREDTDFDTQGYDARLGGSYAFGRFTARAGWTRGRLRLDDRNYRDAYGLNAQLDFDLDPRNRITVFGQHSRLRFAQAGDRANDADVAVAGATWLHALADERTVLAASAFAGNDNDRRARIDGDKSFAGLRLAAQHRWSDTLTLFAGAGLQYGHYETRNLLFLKRRKDRQTDLSAGAVWAFAPDWSLRPRLAYTDNDSNVDINAYDRTEFSIALRRDLR